MSKIPMEINWKTNGMNDIVELQLTLAVSALTQACGGTGVGILLFKYTCSPVVAKSEIGPGRELEDSNRSLSSTKVVELRVFASCWSKASWNAAL